MKYLNIICLFYPTIQMLYHIPFSIMRYVNSFCHTTLSKLNQTKTWQPQGQARFHIRVTKGQIL